MFREIKRYAVRVIAGLALLASLYFPFEIQRIYGATGTPTGQTLANGTQCTTLSLIIGCYIYPQAVLQVPQILPDGANATPSLAWANSPTTGIYRDTGNLLHFVFGAIDAGNWGTGGINNTIIGAGTARPGTFTIATAAGELRGPAWTTGGRPVSPTIGEQGFNTTLNAPEWWNGSQWISIQSAGTQVGSTLIAFPSVVNAQNGTYPLIASFPWASGLITSVTYYIGGTSPSLTASLQINGSNVAGCNGLVATSSTPASATCTSASVTRGALLQVIISGVSGSPNTGAIEIHYTHTAT